MAVVGKGFAIVQTGPVKMSGFMAWLAWAFVHIQFLALGSMRVSVFIQWMWTFFTGSRGSRIIVNHATPSANIPAVAQAEPAVSRDVPTSAVGQKQFNEAPQDGHGNGNPIAKAAAPR
jgi:hypothetical protein